MAPLHTRQRSSTPSARRDVVDTTAEARVAREAWAWTQPVFLNCPGATVQGYRPRLYWCGVETRANFVGGRGYAPAATVVERAHGCRALGAGGRNGGGGG